MDSSPAVNSDPRRNIPSVDRLARALEEVRPDLAHWAGVEAARWVIEKYRARIASPDPSGDPSDDEMDWVALAEAEASRLLAPRPGRVINATGVVLHTNLGRSPIAEGAAAAAAAAAAGYSDLELDLATGRRGNRLGGLEEKLRLLSGAEAAYACNNNAAALMLVLGTLAAGREVIVSRGELVEIGGSFRVPAIMERAGVVLVEVGSTNRTHPSDYEEAIGPDTALLLKVHRSNFELRGFVKEVGLGELVEIGRRHGVPVVEDLGSGTLVDLTQHGFPEESFVPSRLRLGPDLVCFSGDKLMGGPQAGIALGSEAVVAAMRTNPLARALRLDKMTLSALDWTLARMLDGSAERELPVLRALLIPADELRVRCEALAKKLVSLIGIPIEVIPDRVPVGGGSLPGFELDGWVIALRPPVGAATLAERLRRAALPILARVRDGAVLLDLRTIEAREMQGFEAALIAALR